MTNWTWGNNSGGDQVVKITAEAVAAAAADPKPATKAATPKASPFLWALSGVSLVFSAIAVILLVYFFKYPPAGLSGPQIINRYHTIVLFAGLFAALAIIAGASVFDFARRKKSDLPAPARIAGVLSIILAAGLLGTTVFCWSRTESTVSLSAPRQNDALLQRLQAATTVIQMHDLDVNRYRSIKREGVIIASDAGRTWILTVPYVDGDGRLVEPKELWVSLSDGQTLPGRFLFAVAEPANLGVVEVAASTPPGLVQLHPTAEAIIPSKSVFVIPNPLQGWTLATATILSRATRRTKIGWNCVVETDLKLDGSDVGSAMYDEAGRLMGFMTSLDNRSGNSRFVLIDSATVAALETLRGRKDVNAQNSPQEQQP